MSGSSGARKGCRAGAEKPRVPTPWMRRWGGGRQAVIPKFLHVSRSNLLQHLDWLWLLPHASSSVPHCGEHTGSLPPNSRDRGMSCLPVHPEPSPGRHPLGSAPLLLPIHWASSHPDGACLIDSICPTVKTLRRCQPPSSPPSGSQQTPAKDLRLGVLPGATTGCGEASDPMLLVGSYSGWPSMQELRSHLWLKDCAIAYT